ARGDRPPGGRGRTGRAAHDFARDRHLGRGAERAVRVITDSRRPLRHPSRASRACRRRSHLCGRPVLDASPRRPVDRRPFPAHHQLGGRCRSGGRPVTAIAVLAGCMVAAGLILLVRELWPGPPRLEAALARIQPVPFPSAEVRDDSAPLAERVGRWLAERVGRPVGLLANPRTDLALLGRPVERFMLDKLAWFRAGLAVPSLLTVLVGVAGSSLPWTFPVLAGLVLAAVLSLVPDCNVRAKARQR